jgi:hypothetical protein
MTSNVRTRRVSSPAYYLGRPATLWIAAFTPRPAGANRAPASRLRAVHEATNPAARERLPPASCAAGLSDAGTGSTSAPAAPLVLGLYGVDASFML